MRPASIQQQQGLLTYSLPKAHALGLYTDSRPVYMAKDRSSRCKAHNKTASWMGTCHWALQAAGLVAHLTAAHHGAVPRRSLPSSIGNAHNLASDLQHDGLSSALQTGPFSKNADLTAQL